MILEIRNKYMSINIQKILPKVTQRYRFSKVTLSAMPHYQNSIGKLSFLTVFGNPKSDWNIKIA